MAGSTNKHIGRFLWPGQIAEVVFYQRMLTDGECREVILCLAGNHRVYR
ncbi:MAG: hypothetical protein GX639_01700 [Fibrobacter sp.]|nr:hypothetical protein [Fibrobacter sp.]